MANATKITLDDMIIYQNELRTFLDEAKTSGLVSEKEIEETIMQIDMIDQGIALHNKTKAIGKNADTFIKLHADLSRLKMEATLPTEMKPFFEKQEEIDANIKRELKVDIKDTKHNIDLLMLRAKSLLSKPSL